MTRIITVHAVLALLIGLQAEAAPFDYLLSFPTEAAAIADPVVGTLNPTHTPVTGWRADICLPGIFAGSSSTTTVNNVTTTTYTPYDSNWLMSCSFMGRQDGTNGSLNLESESTTHLIVDAELGATPSAILYAWVNPATLGAYFIQPIWQGRSYPFGSP